MDDNAEGTVTGRLKTQAHDIEFLPVPGIPTYLRDLMELLAKESMDSIGIDFSQMADRPAAMLVTFVDGKPKYEHIDTIQGRKPDLVIIDEVSMLPDYEQIELRMLAELGNHRGGKGMSLYELQAGVFGDLIGEEVTPKKRFKHGFFEVDYDPDEMRRQARKPDIKKLAKARKDKSYLALDPTKNHRKRRR